MSLPLQIAMMKTDSKRKDTLLKRHTVEKTQWGRKSHPYTKLIIKFEDTQLKRHSGEKPPIYEINHNI